MKVTKKIIEGIQNHYEVSEDCGNVTYYNVDAGYYNYETAKDFILIVSLKVLDLISDGLKLSEILESLDDYYLCDTISNFDDTETEKAKKEYYFEGEY